jgi:hypothetical protein
MEKMLDDIGIFRGKKAKGPVCGLLFLSYNLL